MPSDGQKQLLNRWQELASAAAKETDPQKLVRIVKDLCSLLDAEGKRPAHSASTPTNLKRAQRQASGRQSGER